MLFQFSYVVFTTTRLFAITSAKPLSSPQPEGDLEISEVPVNFVALSSETSSSNILFSNDPSDYSLFLNTYDNSVGPESSDIFPVSSDGDTRNNLVTSCLSEINLDPPTALDILRPRDSLDGAWTSLSPQTENGGQKCANPYNQAPKPPPPSSQPELRLPSLLEDLDFEKCPPLPDGTKRQALCCYGPDIKTGGKIWIAQTCWSC